MNALRILEIAHDHPAWTAGGTEFVAHDLTRAFEARDGVSVRLLVATTTLQRPGAAPGSLQAIGPDHALATGRYDRFTMLRDDGSDWLDGLGRVLGSLRPDVVHLHGLDRLGAEILPAIRRLAPRSRIVLTLHDYQLICPNEGLLLTIPEGRRCAGMQPDRCQRCFPEIAAARHALRRAHLQSLLQLVDLFIAPSAFLKARFVDWGLDPARLRVIPNAVRLADAPVAEARGARPRNRFGFFGNLAAHKGVPVLLDAAARLQAQGADLSLDIHGGLGWADEDFRAQFAGKLAAAAPLVQHIGAYERSDLPALMARTDWVVAPSVWWENAPLVILEARAAGRPVICSGIGGMAELVRDGVDGLHVPPGDAAALAGTMARVAGDGGLWERLAPAPTSPLAHDAFVAAHLDLFRTLFNRAAA